MLAPPEKNQVFFWSSDAARVRLRPFFWLWTSSSLNWCEIGSRRQKIWGSETETSPVHKYKTRRIKNKDDFQFQFLSMKSSRTRASDVRFVRCFISTDLFLKSISCSALHVLLRGIHPVEITAPGWWRSPSPADSAVMMKLRKPKVHLLWCFFLTPTRDFSLRRASEWSGAGLLLPGPADLPPCLFSSSPCTARCWLPGPDVFIQSEHGDIWLSISAASWVWRYGKQSGW